METNPESHEMKVETKRNFMAYTSTLTVELTNRIEKTTKVSVSAETPVTTITKIVDLGEQANVCRKLFLARVGAAVETGTRQTSKKVAC